MSQLLGGQDGSTTQEAGAQSSWEIDSRAERRVDVASENLARRPQGLRIAAAQLYAGATLVLASLLPCRSRIARRSHRTACLSRATA